jgi:hypothetical protein
MISRDAMICVQIQTLPIRGDPKQQMHCYLSEKNGTALCCQSNIQHNTSKHQLAEYADGTTCTRGFMIANNSRSHNVFIPCSCTLNLPSP